ncbi:MAG: HDOD domain-containing protein [Pseudomonadales bacterium]|nr:HDOD domain-containing protein [Pseudomonadales bacterium]
MGSALSIEQTQAQKLPDHPSLKNWVSCLSKEDLPLFDHTARRIAEIADADHSTSSAANIAEIILSDTVMTARVLRTANAAYYNPSNQSIHTVSKAIVVLGFNTVRNISLSISMIDTVLSGVQHERAQEELVRSFHAAIQAKEIARAQGKIDVEEIFIAALLHRVGHMLFWCFPYGHAAQLDKAYRKTDDECKAETTVLGFSLKALTHTLTEHWHLSPILDTALKIGFNKNDEKGEHRQKIDCVELGYEVAIASKAGWDEPITQEKIVDIAAFLKADTSDATEIVFNSAKKATRALADLGLNSALNLISAPPQPNELMEENAEVEVEVEINPQYALQLSILRDLCLMLGEQFDLNTLLATVMEGIHRSLNMQHTVFALAGPKKIQAKHIIGKNRDVMLRRFNFGSRHTKLDIFNYVMQTNKPLWISENNRDEYSDRITPEILKCIGRTDFFVMPIRVGGVPKGILYTDRNRNTQSINEQDFQTFIHFCEHVNIGFKILSQRKNI